MYFCACHRGMLRRASNVNPVPGVANSGWLQRRVADIGTVLFDTFSVRLYFGSAADTR
jgi:hypothetical protein